MAGIWNTGIWDTGIWSTDGAVVEADAGGSSSGKGKARRIARPVEPYSEFLQQFLNPPAVVEPIRKNEDAELFLLLMS